MDRINIRNLAMNITNKCNLNCSNCTCKDDNLDMSKKVIDKTFEQVRKVRNLHIYGGEPMLAMDQLEYILQDIISNNVKIRKIYITTNATKYDPEFLRLLHCMDIYLKYNYKISSVKLNILKDDEHNKALKKLGMYKETLEYIKKYKESEYFSGFCREPKIFTKFSNISKNYITYINRMKMFDRENGICNIGPLIAINPDGLITKANATFKEQETLYNYGNINDDTIEEIALRNSVLLNPIDWYTKMKVIR